MTFFQEVPVGSQQQGQQREQELIAFGDPAKTYQEWFRTSTEPANFFQQLLAELQQLGIQHYHLRLTNGSDANPGWTVSVRYSPESGEEDAGPVTVQRCMSCHMDANLAEGVLGSAGVVAYIASGSSSGTCGSSSGSTIPTSSDSLVMETDRMHVWLDAKARPLLVVTPKRVRGIRESANVLLIRVLG